MIYTYSKWVQYSDDDDDDEVIDISCLTCGADVEFSPGHLSGNKFQILTL